MSLVGRYSNTSLIRNPEIKIIHRPVILLNFPRISHDKIIKCTSTFIIIGFRSRTKATTLRHYAKQNTSGVEHAQRDNKVLKYA